MIIIINQCFSDQSELTVNLILLPFEARKRKVMLVKVIYL